MRLQPAASCIGIVTDHDDLHALTAQKALSSYEGVQCHVIECDRIAERGGLAWTNAKEHGLDAVLPTTAGRVVDVSSLDVIWFRRCNVSQTVIGEITDPVHVELINASTPIALLGVLFGGFTGRWISDPGSTRHAENKVVQLKVAREAGIATPSTLVSNDPTTIRRFCEMLDYEVVVKGLRASSTAIMLTQKLQAGHLDSDESMRLCPAIYQEFICGSEHLRVHVFGDYVATMLIESAALDWRGNLDVPCREYVLDDATIARLHRVLKALNLRMGVFDLKMSSGVPTWIELNPQGQFLFAQGLSGLPLDQAMASFLHREALMNI